MKDGFLKVCGVPMPVKLGGVAENVSRILEETEKAVKDGAKLVVFPELCLTGATAGDLFFTKTLIEAAANGLLDLQKRLEKTDALVVLGLPLFVNGGLFDVAAVLCRGKVLGFVPRSDFSLRHGIDLSRWFSFGGFPSSVRFNGEDVPFSTDLAFSAENMADFSFSVRLGDEVFTKSLLGSNVNLILNPSSFSETVSEENERLAAFSVLSRETPFALISVSSGVGESTTDGCLAGQAALFECGELLIKSSVFSEKPVISDFDLSRVSYTKNALFRVKNADFDRKNVIFTIKSADTLLDRTFDKTPFIPKGENAESELERVLRVAEQGLISRLSHISAKKLILGLSGGLDSTLAVLISSRALKRMGRSEDDLLLCTMPCFGTTSQTLDNSILLAKALKASLKKIDISKAVSRHLKDIDHKDGVFDTAFENAQARERTQVLMDLSNMENGLVVGTGDLSEVALGWSTYNGDHMSMYGVNASIPKTLVRALVTYVANHSKHKLKTVLYSILDTPVSPELIPPKDGEITQKTEEIVGPYILHDFYLYAFTRLGATPEKALRMAKKAFLGEYDDETLRFWLKKFVKRFISQQFKRSCMPDGVKATRVSLSPRGAFNMPSDAFDAEFLKGINE